MVRPTGNQAAAWGNILSWGPSQGNANNMVLIGISSAAAGLEPFIAPLGTSLEEGTSMSIGTAYIIEFWSDGNNVNSSTYGIGLNDGAISLTNFTHNTFGSLNNATPVDLGVGHSPAISLWLDADIAEIQLYNYLLPEEERQTIGVSLQNTWGISAGTFSPSPNHRPSR